MAVTDHSATFSTVRIPLGALAALALNMDPRAAVPSSAGSGPVIDFAAGVIAIPVASAAMPEGIQPTVRQAIEEVVEQTAHVMAAAA
jgi:hypothetical protein